MKRAVVEAASLRLQSGQQRRAFLRHRAAGLVGFFARQVDHHLDRPAEGGRVGSGHGHHDDRQHDTPSGGDAVEMAGKAAQVRPRLGRRRGKPVAPGLHLRFAPCHAAAGEHGISHIGGGRETTDGDIEASDSGVSHRHERGAQRHVEFGGDPRGGRGQGGRGAAFQLRPDGEAGAIAAEGEGKAVAADRVAQSGNGGRAGGVDRLVAPPAGKAGGIDHIGQADQPVIGQAGIKSRLQQTGKAAEHRHPAIERGRGIRCGKVAWRRHGGTAPGRAQCAGVLAS